MKMANPIDLVWDTDIGRDPDDFLAGCLLLSRPDIRLRAVTISPGDRDQVALARFLLEETGNADVPIGTVPSRARGKKSVQGCHLRLLEYYGAPRFVDADGAGWEVLAAAIEACRGACLLTTGPLNNVGDFIKHSDIPIERSVSMAGYWAAPGEEPRLPEFNFNGCKPATRSFLQTDRIKRRLLVGKNITHSVFYSDSLHEALRAASGGSRALGFAAELMSLRSGAKKLHDPVAALAVLREDLFAWEEVMPQERANRWGSHAVEGTGIWATTALDEAGFRSVFTGSDWREPAAEEANSE